MADGRASSPPKVEGRPGTRLVTRRGLLGSAAVGAVAGGALAAGIARRGGSTREVPDRAPLAPAGSGELGVLELLVTDTPFGAEDGRRVTDRATVRLGTEDG